MNNFQLIGIIAGLSAGIVWEKLATSAFGHFRTLFPSVFVKEGGSTIHLHHWVIYAIVIVLLLIWAYKTGRLTHPAILFLISALMGGILYDFLTFKDFAVFAITKIKSKNPRK